MCPSLMTQSRAGLSSRNCQHCVWSFMFTAVKDSFPSSPDNLGGLGFFFLLDMATGFVNQSNY